MKTVAWKPLRRWTCLVYSRFSSHRGNGASRTNGPELTSQDPIIWTNDPSHGGYKLSNMDAKKVPIVEQERQFNVLEKAIAQLPSATRDHPHFARENIGIPQPLCQRARSPRLEISKETSFFVTSASEENVFRDIRNSASLTALPNGHYPRRSRS